MNKKFLLITVLLVAIITFYIIFNSVFYLTWVDLPGPGEEDSLYLFPRSRVVEVGEEIIVENYSIKINKVLPQSNIFPCTFGKGHRINPSDYDFLFLDSTVKNIEDQPGFLGELSFKGKSEYEDTDYSIEVATENCSIIWGERGLKPNESMNGYIIFKVYKGTKIEELQIYYTEPALYSDRTISGIVRLQY